jgi:FAD/FMN-containing dehydrogenase
MPGGTGWDLARRSWNLAVDQRPAAVALPESADDVRAAIELARARDLRIAPQGTGHGALSLDPLEGTILLNTSRMRGVQVDAPARYATVQAGALWGEVATVAAQHGLAGLAGSSPTVGVVGYSLGGGLGWLARRYGLAANSIVAADVVLADGQFFRADPAHEPDLFWAIRGGGGSFGVVTALEFALYPVREVCGGAMFWPPERAREVLHAWCAWTDSAPDEVTSIARLRRVPSRPEFPERLQGRSFVIVEAAYAGSETMGAELLRPLRALGPEIDTFRMVPMTELGPLHLDPLQPMPRIGDGRLLATFPAQAADALCVTEPPGSG